MVAFEDISPAELQSSSSNDELSPNRLTASKSPPQTDSDQDKDTNSDQGTNDKDIISPNKPDRPTLSYVSLISMAILNHPEKRMVLGDIYQYIMDKYPHYKNSEDRAWRNSIRHNLSINECFIKVGRLENGKGNYWAIHPACIEDFSKGDFRRRQARRRARRSQNLNVSCMSSSYKSNLQYIPMASAPASGLSSSKPNSVLQERRDFTNVHSVRNHPYARPATHRHNYLSSNEINITNHTQASLHAMNMSHMRPLSPSSLSLHPLDSSSKPQAISPPSHAQRNYYLHSSVANIPRERPPVGKVNTSEIAKETRVTAVASSEMNMLKYDQQHYHGDDWMHKSISRSYAQDSFRDLESLRELYKGPAIQIPTYVPLPSRDVSAIPSSTTVTSLNNRASLGCASGADLVAAIGGSMFVPSLASFAPGKSFTEMPALRDAINGLSCLSY